MNRLQSSVIVICVVLGLFVVMTIGFLFIPIRPDNTLQISFLTYTNDAKLGKLAVFAVTNFNNENISFEPCNSQTNNFDHWPQIEFVGDVKTLTAQAATNFIVTVSTNWDVWRQPIFWTYDQPSKFELYRSKIKANLYFNWRLISQGNRPRYINISTGNSHMAFSSVITNR